VLLVSAALRHLNIFDDHVSNDLTAMLARQQILSECCCGDLRQVLVLSNSEYLLLGSSGTTMEEEQDQRQFFKDLGATAEQTVEEVKSRSRKLLSRSPLNS